VKALLPEKLDAKRVLDIGCGTGDVAGWLSKQGSIVVAIDCSEAMIAIAQERNGSAGADFRRVSFEEFQADSSSFDCVVASFMLGYFGFLPAFFQKAAMLLAPDGSLVASMLHPVRTLASGRFEEGYVVRHYCDHQLYQADFLGKDAVIPLHAWRFCDVVNSASAEGLVLDALHEPNLPKALATGPKAFYSDAPSVTVMRFRHFPHR